MADPRKPMEAAPLRAEIDRLLAASLSDEELRASLERLAREPRFSGFTWLYGPRLYARNRVLFRPLLLAQFSSFEPRGERWRHVLWQGARGEALARWLEEADRVDDVELCRRLIQWRYTPARGWGLESRALAAELVRCFHAAPSPAARHVALAKRDLWLELDEQTALALYRVDARAARPFVLKHLPWPWRPRARKLWSELAGAARDAGDEPFALELYRRQVPLDVWRRDVLALCDSVLDGGALVEALERRHPEGYGLDLGEAFYELVRRRERDVLPYIARHLRHVWSGWLRGGYDRLLELARERGWLDLWGALVRVCSRPDEFNREVRRLVEDRALSDDAAARRLLLLAGVSREWSFPGLGLAQVRPLDEATALALYRRFPGLVRGPFKLHVAVTWGHAYPELIEALVEAGDEELVDFMASRLLTRAGPGWEKSAKPVAERVSRLYEELRERDAASFARRAASVLGQVPAYAIFNYDHLIRENRLARLLLERSAASALADPRGMRDLVEASEIHVQALAYRTLGLADDRARTLAAESLDLLLGTLLRPLHRRTRTLAFGALLNAAITPENARRIHERAREALVLPDTRYPKEKLVGLIGALLQRFPELRTEREHPVVHEARS